MKKKTIKRIMTFLIAVILVASFVFSFTACNNGVGGGGGGSNRPGNPSNPSNPSNPGNGGNNPGNGGNTGNPPPPSPSYGIYLSETGTYVFPPAIQRYGTQTERTITVNNAGNQAQTQAASRFQQQR